MNPFYAMIRPDGSVAFVASMGVSETERNNALSQGLEAVAVPENVPPEEIVKNWYYINNSWIERPPQPAPYYAFNIDKFIWEDTRTPQSEWEVIKNRRSILLTESDWTMLPDAPLSDAKRAEWVVYRQALRDITNQTDPFNISWPTPPEQ